jgi:hypothetical protein
MIAGRVLASLTRHVMDGSVAGEGRDPFDVPIEPRAGLVQVVKYKLVIMPLSSPRWFS